jgi:DNA replication protein DnaC
MLTEIKTLLKALKLNQALIDVDAFIKQFKSKEEFLLALLQSESKKRYSQNCIRKITSAKFPFTKEWAQINPKLNPKVPFSELKKYSDGKFVEDKRNLCFIGEPGVGKTHSLVAIGRDLCRKGHSVYFYTAIQLTTLLEEAQERRELSSFMEKIKKAKLIIIDELGFVPFSEKSARLLFDVFSQRYENGSIAVTSNLSFEKWSQVFGSVELTAALIDRFTHKADIYFFDGDSARLKDATKK